MQYYSTLKAKLIYIFTISDQAHSGCVKIGEATLDEATNLTLPPNCKELNAAARKRIDQYTKTAGIEYTLRHTELTVAIHGGIITTFNDKAVHESFCVPVSSVTTSLTKIRDVNGLNVA